MLGSLSKLIVMLTIFIVLSGSMVHTVQATNWRLHAHDAGACGSADEIDAVYDRMYDEELDGTSWDVYKLTLEPAWKYLQCSIAMSKAKTFHFAGHSEYNRMRATDALFPTYVYATDIPSLDDVVGGGPMLLAFVSGCESAKNPSSTSSLKYNFLEQGAESFIGYATIASGPLCVDVADYFYSWIEQGYNVSRSYDETVEEYDLPRWIPGNGYYINDLKLYGDGSVVLTD